MKYGLQWLQREHLFVQTFPKHAILVGWNLPRIEYPEMEVKNRTITFVRFS